MVKELYTPEEVADILKINPHTVRQYLRDDKLKGFKIGRSWRVKEEDLKEFINQS